MTETVAVVRGVGSTWIESMTAPVRRLGRRAVLLTPLLTRREREQLEPLVDAVHECDDVHDPAALADTALAACGDHPLAALVTAEDAMITTVARAADLAGVARCSARAFELARNKFLTRCALADAGLPGPRFTLMGPSDTAADVVSQVGLPAVLKPVNGVGSHLVHVVRTVEELHDAYAHAVQRAPAGRLAELYARPLEGRDDTDIDPARVFLVEEMITGHEYSIDVVIRDGEIEHVAMADKAILDDKLFECGFISPPLDLDAAAHMRMRACVDSALRAIGLDNSVAHVELRDDGPGQTHIIEINAGRPAGQLLSQIFEMNTGVDLAAELVTATCGWPSTRTTPRVAMPLASLTKYSDIGGRLIAMNGLDAVEMLPDVIAVIPLGRLGDVLSDESETFTVNVVAAGFFDLDDLLETYRQVDALIELVVEPEEATA